MTPSNNYVLISPCRDEADYMRQTLDSIVAQSVRPAKWVIIDDGSTDNTPQILAEYASKHNWIEIVTRIDRGKRAVGPEVIDASYAGLDTINMGDCAYMCKLDLDLEIPSAYFEQVAAQMEVTPRLANFSGKPYLHEKDGSLISERLGNENAIDQIKLYRAPRIESKEYRRFFASLRVAAALVCQAQNFRSLSIADTPVTTKQVANNILLNSHHWYTI